MKPNLIKIILIVLIVLISSFRTAKQPDKTIVVLSDLIVQWSEYLHDKKLAESMNLYTDDAMFYAPGGHVFNGKKEINALYTAIFKEYNSSIAFTTRKIEVSGKMAWYSGDYKETLTDRATSKDQAVSGSCIIVFRLDADGHWRIVQHMWTMVTPG